MTGALLDRVRQEAHDSWPATAVAGGAGAGAGSGTTIVEAARSSTADPFPTVKLLNLLWEVADRNLPGMSRVWSWARGRAVLLLNVAVAVQSMKHLMCTWRSSTCTGICGCERRYSLLAVAIAAAIAAAALHSPGTPPIYLADGSGDGCSFRSCYRPREARYVPTSTRSEHGHPP